MRQQSARSSPADAPASDAGSSGLLSSLWRNLSGGSNPPSLPSTRAGSIVDENAGIEHLAIGFAEMSGSLVLAASYIRPEQMELLLAHNGTDYVARKGIGSPPIGGGLSGWMPTAGSSNGTSSRSQKTLPLLVSSPTVLFSELDLGPGESQTFSVKVQLPKSLPPSFRGRTGRISYDLVIVAKRSMLEPSAHVVRIPFRVLAYVGSSGALDTFSMARPIQMQPGHIKLTYQDEITVSTPRNTSPSFSSEQDEHSQLGSHSKHETLGVEFLPPLASLEDPKENTSEVYKQLTSSLFLQSLIQAIDSEMSADPQVVPSIELFSHSTILESSSNGDDSDSARNIQLACRKRAPVSFSLSQDGHAVASVWLPKRVYQLGDIVAGKVDIHQGAVSVYQVSIWLESVETIGSDYASCAQSRTEELTRRVYSEHHGFCRSMRTLGFSLAPPQTTAATAASFNSSIISNVWQLRIELIIGASGSPAASDYTLSAATPFPPVKLLPHSAWTDSQSSVQLMPAKDTLSDDDRTLASQRYHYPPISAGASGSVSDHVASNVRSSSGRLRSSTIVGNGVGVIGAMHQHRHRVNDGDSRAMQPVAQHASTSAFQRTVRRRYDAVPKLATQTLSCTVAIQMHPSPLKLPHPGHKDVYSIDIGTQ
ncbi:Golgi membrane exchange factor (Ric1p-Rgp1p) subunit [Coemansia sp. RSA 1933]|nr:Golgi membrane exchange factor (Ric1p-Rgp1p) subunit [Coemansia sp. RSA 1933]